MKLYYANLLSAKGLEKYLNHKINVLAAFPSFPKSGVSKPPFCSSLFVDSGAFGKNSAKVTISDYIDFIHANKQKIDLYANLDVIGMARATKKNQRIMEKEGLSPLPVFHYGSEEKYLKWYLAQGYDYISLGGMVPISPKQLIFWLDRIWEECLTNKDGSPKVKVHGFGLQIPSLIKRYPWHSVDASTVHVAARYGEIETRWGRLSINPACKNYRIKIKTPRNMRRIKEFAHIHSPAGATFEHAQEQNSTGTLIRCAISINYLHKWVLENACRKYGKGNGKSPPAFF